MRHSKTNQLLLRSVILTIVLFAALSLYLIYSNWGRGVTEPMFG